MLLWPSSREVLCSARHLQVLTLQVHVLMQIKCNVLYGLLLGQNPLDLVESSQSKATGSWHIHCSYTYVHCASASAKVKGGIQPGFPHLPCVMKRVIRGCRRNNRAHSLPNRHALGGTSLIATPSLATDNLPWIG